VHLRILQFAGLHCAAATPHPPEGASPLMMMPRAQVARWLEPSLWLLIFIRTGSILLLPSSVNRIPLILVLLRPTAEVLLVSAATAHGVRLATVAVLALLSRFLMNLAMFILLTRYAPVLTSRFLPQQQFRIVDWLRWNATKRGLLIICAIHPSKIVAVACALARVKLARFVVSIVIGNTFVILAYLVIGRHFTAELRFVIDWIWASRWWLTAALLPLIGFPVVLAIRQRR
jgi:uncharacterized membrane protein YdjX (TVP38/TMEM64 family)